MEQEVKTIINKVDTLSSSFGEKIPSIECKLLDEVLLLLKKLDVKNGKIVQNTANLKSLTKLNKITKKTILSKEFQKEVVNFLKSFNTVEKLQNKYFSKNFDTQKAHRAAAAYKNIAIQNTADMLLGTGIDNNVVNPLKKIITESILSGVSYSNIIGNVKEALNPSDGKDGIFTSHAKTYAITGLSQFSREYNQLVAKDLDVEYYMYVGSEKETTREWCKYMLEKKYIHKSEFKDVLKGNIDGHQCEIYDKTEMPKGMIEGTNEDNLAARCGGWNCQHALMPVSSAAVPDDIKLKIEEQKLTPKDKSKRIERTPEQIAKIKTEWEKGSNNRAIERKLGITKGEEMDFEKANELRGNINFKK